MMELWVLLGAFSLLIGVGVWFGTGLARISGVVAIVLALSSFGLYGLYGGWPQLKAAHAYEHMVQVLNELYDEPVLTEQKVELTLNDLEKNIPEDPFLWFRMGEIYEKLQWYPQAQLAFEKAFVLSPDNRDIQIKYAYASAFANKGRLDEDALRVTQTLLANNPQDDAARNLLAMNYLQQGDSLNAGFIWQKMLSESGHIAKERLAILKAHQQAMKVSYENPIENTPLIFASVQLDETLASQTDGEWPVFIMAKKTQQSGPPLAVTRMKVSDLPAIVVLSKEQAMRGDVTLDSGQDIIVTARVSKKLSPIASKGDLEGRSELFRLSGTHHLNITVNHIIE